MDHVNAKADLLNSKLLIRSHLPLGLQASHLQQSQLDQSRRAQIIKLIGVLLIFSPKDALG